jgi:glycosyltransferase involved in cell wall biosynthesis
VLSLIIPVYKNEASIGRLLAELVKLEPQIADGLEVVFVVDGSPDRTFDLLAERLPKLGLCAQLVALSRNFGSFSAIAAGLTVGRGEYFAVITADLQEPPQLVVEFDRVLRSGAADVVFGCRTARSDPLLTEAASSAFWWIYRKLVVREVPPGGIDVFGCTRQVRDHVIRFREAHSSLIVLLFWLGFRRSYVSYQRAPRLEGRSAWTLRKKLQYCVDSIFSFTDLPVQVLMYAGVLGMAIAAVWGAMLLAARLGGTAGFPDYSGVALAILFFGALTSLGLGIVGEYVWLALENSRGRPNFIIASTREYPKAERRPAD